MRWITGMTSNRLKHRFFLNIEFILPGLRALAGRFMRQQKNNRWNLKSDRPSDEGIQEDKKKW